MPKRLRAAARRIEQARDATTWESPLAGNRAANRPKPVVSKTRKRDGTGAFPLIHCGLRLVRTQGTACAEPLGLIEKSPRQNGSIRSERALDAAEMPLDRIAFDNGGQHVAVAFALNLGASIL